MAPLDDVIQLQAQGISDTDINKQLRDKGISPKDINDALNQAKIKMAVTQSHEEQFTDYSQAQGMQQSISDSEQPQLAAPVYQEEPSTQNSEQQYYPNQQAPQQQYQYPTQSEQANPEQQYYSQTYAEQPAQEYQYPDSNQYYQTDTGTITEIAEQVVAEKFEEFNKKTGDLASFKNQIQDKVEELDERLKRIENNIDKLQQAIIRKIGEFGDTSSYIHKDLENLHNTVSKLMNPLVDNYNELRKITGSKK
ncbi:MAG: hypothetical protein Q7S33_05110 [Nanoarchaeota archaeon]|nr:hypothetical protein [Nanoarchaeota archaeon]